MRPTRRESASNRHGKRTRVLAVGALGVVYGEIGTNPLLAMREAFTARHSVAFDAANIVDLLSLMSGR